MVPKDIACPACVEDVTNFVAHNTKALSELNCYYILSSTDQNAIQKTLDSYKIDPSLPIIKPDNKGLFLKYISSEENNPMLVYIQNGEIIYKKSFPPAQLDDLYKIMQEYYTALGKDKKKKAEK